MRKTIALAALALFFNGVVNNSARAADLGKPATLDEIIALPAAGTALSGCFGEASAAGAFLAEGARQATGSIGAGCTVKAGPFIYGGGIRANWGDFTSGDGWIRAGVLINPNLALYIPLVWSMPDWKAARTGSLSSGLGLETTIGRSDMSTFIEGTYAASKWGREATRDDFAIRGGFRIYVK